MKTEEKKGIWDFEYKSETIIRGLPLVHVSGKWGKLLNGIITISRGFGFGIINVSQFGFGIINVSQFGFGIINISQFGIGIINVSQVGFGIISISQLG